MSDAKTLEVLREIVRSNVSPMIQLTAMILILEEEYFTDERLRKMLADLRERTG